MTFHDYFNGSCRTYGAEDFDELLPVLKDIRAFEYNSSGGLGADGAVLLMDSSGNVYPVRTLDIDRTEEATRIRKSITFDRLLTRFPLTGNSIPGWTVTDLKGGVRLGALESDTVFRRAVNALKKTVAEDHPAVRIFGDIGMVRDSAVCIGFAETYSRLAVEG